MIAGPLTNEDTRWKEDKQTSEKKNPQQYWQSSSTRNNSNIISGTAGGRKFQKRKHIEPIEMERLWFDVTHLFEELLLAFD